jgi:hypothetical protein
MILTCLVTAGVSSWLYVLTHELGHAVVTLAVRLPLTEINVCAGPQTPVHAWAGVKVRIGLLGTASHVRIDALAERRPRHALRCVLMALGGPAASLLLAGAIGLVYRSIAVPSLVQAAVLIAAVVGVLYTLPSLVPIRRRLAASSDGWRAIAWTFQPQRTAQRTREWALISRENHAHKARQPIDRSVIDPLLTSSDSVVAAAAGILLLRPRDPASRPELVSKRSQLSQIAQARGVPRWFAGVLIELLLRTLIDEIIDDPPPDLVADGVALAELGRRLDGSFDPNRTALALLQVWQGQPLTARHLLRHANVIPNARDRATALAVQALAECELGEVAQASELAAAARKTAPTADWVTTLTAQVAQRTATG